MPLVKSKTKEAFRENIRREVSAGRPVKQAVAIAYSTKRNAGNGGRHHVSGMRKFHARHGY